jgi:Rrf2 family iron-sulfur cluster assembly transcriptional regulator
MGEIKLTTRGKYAVMAMVELSNYNSSSPVPLSEIAKNSNISLSYLEQLIAALRRNNLVKSHRGPCGGYMLARKPSEITVSQILHAAEQSLPAKRPAANNNIKNEATRYLWSDIDHILDVCLARVTLADVIDRKTLANQHIAKVFENLS